MSSYRLRRRAFLAGVGGAFGLRILLDNLEASAEGATSPPRLFTLFWPSGTVRHHFLPAVTGRNYTTPRTLQPFEAAGLREDLIALYGLSQASFRHLGGGAEGGTVVAVTGADSPATRQLEQGELDDPIAGGPSFDQIFLKHAPTLRGRSGYHFVNTIADARVDSYETSTQCLSYSYEKRDVAVARPTQATLAEHVPLLPHLAPAELYAQLFSGFIPGTDASEKAERAKRALKMRKSVLDSALRELTRIRTLAPSSEWPKIDAHAEAIRATERQLAEQLAASERESCTPLRVDPTLVAKTGSFVGDYANPRAEVEDASFVERVGKAHAAVIRAAFQCDLVRVASLNWCPGTNHVAFGGMYPSDPSAVFMHHPLSHRVVDPRFYDGMPPADTSNFSIYEFFVNVHTWFNQKTADILSDFKQTKDVFGNSLLDHTIVPFVTDVAQPADSNARKPALILGGRALGMQGGTFVDVSTEANRSHNNLWMTIAQAYLNTTDPLALLTQETFNRTGVAPIPDLWLPPR